MIPTTVGAVAAFLLLAAPGGLYFLLRSRYVPATTETQLAEFTRISLASVIATASAAVLLSWMWVSLLADLDRVGEPRFQMRAAVAVLATSALACGLVIVLVWARWWRRASTKAPIIEGRVWYHALVTARPSGSNPYLTVELVDGTTWRGTYFAQDSDPQDADRSLALAQPGLRRRRPAALRPRGWRRPTNPSHFDALDQAMVLLPEAQIRSIQVKYLNIPDG